MGTGKVIKYYTNLPVNKDKKIFAVRVIQPISKMQQKEKLILYLAI